MWEIRISKDEMSEQLVYSGLQQNHNIFMT